MTSSPMAVASSTARVLIVDDESGICRSLEGILADEGYQTLSVTSGMQAMELLSTQSIDLVLLDIWMPGSDGIETLKRIRELHPALPVVMMSGHATIATAMSAMKLGARDFIEKPLDLALTLAAIRRALQSNESSESSTTGAESSAERELDLATGTTEVTRNPIVFREQKLRGKESPQRTLARSAILYGQGLHSGRKSGLILEPLPENSGIHFVAVSEQSAVPAHVDFVSSTGFATTVRSGDVQVGTIEHLMSALCAYGISNLLIKCNGEVPVLDGSSIEFCRLFDSVGVVSQKASCYAIAVPEPIRVGNEKEFIELLPGDGLTIEYTLKYPAPVGEQRMTFTLDGVEGYRCEIAPCRTFGFVKDIGYLQKQGYALGGRFDNFVLFGEQGAINDKLRFPDEPVRHKILDAIGDLFLLGRPLQGKIRACMTGHSDNIDLLRVVRGLL